MRSFPLLLRIFPLLQLERRSQRTIGQLLHWPLAPALQPPLLLLPPPLPLLLPLLLPLPLLPLLPLPKHANTIDLLVAACPIVVMHCCYRLHPSRCFGCISSDSKPLDSWRVPSAIRTITPLTPLISSKVLSAHLGCTLCRLMALEIRSPAF
jgi:hypothetical protein